MVRTNAYICPAALHTCTHPAINLAFTARNSHTCTIHAGFFFYYYYFFHAQRVSQRELVEINEFISRTHIQAIVNRENKDSFHAKGLKTPQTCILHRSCLQPSAPVIPVINLSGKIPPPVPFGARATWAIDKQMASPKDLISWKLDAVFLEGLPSDLLAAGPPSSGTHGGGGEAWLTTSAGSWRRAPPSGAAAHFHARILLQKP